MLDYKVETGWRSRGREPFAESEVKYESSQFDTFEQVPDKRFGKDLAKISQSISRSMSRSRRSSR